MVDEDKLEDKAKIAKHQTNEFYELLQPRNPILKFHLTMMNRLEKEMTVFGLIPEPKKLHNNEVIPPFVYPYQTRPELVLDDEKMIRSVWYNLMITCLKPHIPTNYSQPIGNLKDADIHSPLFRVLPSNVKEVINRRGGDLTGYGVWNERFHNFKFHNTLGGGAYSGFLYETITLEQIPKESILYITREVELIDPGSVEGTAKILKLLQDHETLHQANIRAQAKLKLQMNTLKVQEVYLNNLHPKLTDIKLKWQSKQNENLIQFIQGKRDTLELLRQEAIVANRKRREEIVKRHNAKKVIALKQLQEEQEKEIAKIMEEQVSDSVQSMAPLAKEIEELELRLSVVVA